MIDTTTNIIKRTDVQKNKKTLYLFGDNLVRMGMGGQAKEMRGEPNAVGIITKRFPCTGDECYLSDNDFEYYSHLMTKDIEKALYTYKMNGFENLTIPPLGIGLALLPTKAPKLYEHLLKEIERLKETITNLKPQT